MCSFGSCFAAFPFPSGGVYRSGLSFFVRMAFVCGCVICASSTCVSPSLGFSFESVLSLGLSYSPCPHCVCLLRVCPHISLRYGSSYSQCQGVGRSFPLLQALVRCPIVVGVCPCQLFVSIFVSSSAVFVDVAESTCPGCITFSTSIMSTSW